MLKKYFFCSLLPSVASSFLPLAALDLALALSIFPVAISNVVLYTLKEDSGRITVVRYFFTSSYKGGGGVGFVWAAIKKIVSYK